MIARNEKINVALSKLDRNPLNARKNYTKERIKELAANIRANDCRLVLDPIVRKGDKKLLFRDCRRAAFGSVRPTCRE